MNVPQKPASKPVQTPPRPPPRPGSGKGSDTALEALIRQRRLVEPPPEATPAPSGPKSPA